MLMKILHVTSDNKPGGIQKAFKSYVAALAPLSEFENFYLTPNYLYTNNDGDNANHIKLSWLQKPLSEGTYYFLSIIFIINYLTFLLFIMASCAEV